MDQKTRRKTYTEHHAEQVAAVGTGERTQRRRRRAEPTNNELVLFYRRMMRRFRRLRYNLQELLREDREHNFPESDHKLVELVLFVWNIIPMLFSLLREKTWGRRRELFRKQVRSASRKKRRKIHPVAFIGTGCVIAAAIMVAGTYTIGTTVSYDGEVIATVASEAEAEHARSNLEQVTTRTLGETFTIDEALIQYSSGLLKRQDLVDEASFEADLSEEIGLVTSAYCLYVDGEFIGATPYEGALEELLEQLQKASTTEDTISCSFAEDVEASMSAGMNAHIPKPVDFDLMKAEVYRLLKEKKS